jgi:membrane associated rhomboid family serine protease/Tfp pilus assembly protein PilF
MSEPVVIDERPLQVVPPRPPRVVIATFVILAINILIFILMELAGGSKDPSVLLDFGASYGPYTRRGEYWRLVMPMFIHIGFLHLLVNTYALFLLGRILEQVYGYGRFSLLYVGCGVGSSLLSMTLSEHISAGASGAIFGIAGAMVTVGYLHRHAVPRRWGRVFGRGILPFIAINLVLGFSIPGIDNWGHLGGLVTGALLAALIPPAVEDDPFGVTAERPSQAVVVIPLALVLLAMAATVNRYRVSQELVRLLEEGSRRQAAGDSQAARERFEEAARRLPNDERPYEALGGLFLREDKIPEAIRAYERAHELSPASPRARIGLAAAYNRQGENEKARELIEGLLREQPDLAMAHRWVADLYAQEKSYADAVRHYEEALKRDPADAAAHNNLAWLLATAEDAAFRDADGALRHARRAVELSEAREAAFLDTLAEAHYVSGNFDEAVRVQTRTLELEPQNEEFLEHMERYRKAAGG